jgi:ketosteroid isomerase-like protein
MSEWETKAAIQSALNGYSGAAASLDIEAYLGFFTQDAEFWGVPEMLNLPAPFKGHEQIGAFFGASFAQIEWLQQQNTTTDIEIAPDGKSAKTRTSLTETAKSRNRDAVQIIARYEDELVLTEGGWKFAKRKLVLHRYATLP